VSNRVVLALERAGEELQLDLGVVQFLGDLEEFKGAAAEPFHLVHDEGDLRPEGAVLAGGGEGGLHLGPLAYAGADSFVNRRCTPEASRASTCDWISCVRVETRA
jgi:hypothetical protein